MLATLRDFARLLGVKQADADDALRSERAARFALTRRAFLGAGAAMAAGTAFSFGREQEKQLRERIHQPFWDTVQQPIGAIGTQGPSGPIGVPGVIFVDPQAAAGGNGTVERPYQKLAHALNAWDAVVFHHGTAKAPPVSVAPAHYGQLEGPLALRKGLELRVHGHAALNESKVLTLDFTG